MSEKPGPGFQNIPLRTEEGKKFRDAFREGRSTLNVHFSSLELRIMGTHGDPHEFVTQILKQKADPSAK